MTDSWSVNDVVDELAAAGEAANRAKSEYDRQMKVIRELLPVARVEHGLSVVQLEELIGRAYDRGTISRMTSGAAGTKRPRNRAA